MKTTDEALALAAAQGDGAAFAALLDRHYDRLFGLCFRLTGHRAEAEDLCQDICAILPARLLTYQEKSRVTTWLYRVAVNAAHDRRRKRATHARYATGWGDWEISRRADIVEQADRHDWLAAAMTRLSDNLRDTAALVLDDLTHAEAAQVLGVSEGTVSWRMSEIKRRLRAIKHQEETP